LIIITSTDQSLGYQCGNN